MARNESKYGPETVQLVADLYKSGTSFKDISKIASVSMGSLGHLLKRAQVEPCRYHHHNNNLIEKKDHKTPSKRTGAKQLMMEQAAKRRHLAEVLREDGLSIAKIGQFFGVSRQRGSVLCANTPPPDPKDWISLKELHSICPGRSSLTRRCCNNVRTRIFRHQKYYWRADIETIIAEHENRFCRCGKRLSSNRIRWCSTECNSKYRFEDDNKPVENIKAGWVNLYISQLESIKIGEYVDFQTAIELTGLKKMYFYQIAGHRGLIPVIEIEGRPIFGRKPYNYSKNHCEVIGQLYQTYQERKHATITPSG